MYRLYNWIICNTFQVSEIPNSNPWVRDSLSTIIITGGNLALPWLNSDTTPRTYLPVVIHQRSPPGSCCHILQSQNQQYNRRPHPINLITSAATVCEGKKMVWQESGSVGTLVSPPRSNQTITTKTSALWFTQITPNTPKVTLLRFDSMLCYFPFFVSFCCWSISLLCCLLGCGHILPPLVSCMHGLYRSSSRDAIRNLERSGATPGLFWQKGFFFALHPIVSSLSYWDTSYRHASYNTTCAASMGSIAPSTKAPLFFLSRNTFLMITPGSSIHRNRCWLHYSYTLLRRYGMGWDGFHCEWSTLVLLVISKNHWQQKNNNAYRVHRSSSQFFVPCLSW